MTAICVGVGPAVSDDPDQVCYQEQSHLTKTEGSVVDLVNSLEAEAKTRTLQATMAIKDDVFDMDGSNATEQVQF